MDKKLAKAPVPTGNPWVPSEDDPATVPVPLPVVIVRIQGPFTEKDRKLWALLLHAVWDELEEKQIHELSVTKINQVFRELGGDHNTKWIWESAKRLMQTTVEWEQTEGDERYQGVAVLLSYALTHKEARQTGMLRFAFSPGLIPILKEPGRFARLRVHFLLGLSGKYAVTLYELLESVVNKVDPTLEVPLDGLRQWLKVPDGKLKKYYDFKRFVLEPSIKQINDNPERAGFTVEMKPIKKGRAVHKIRFTLTKVEKRKQLETKLKSPASHGPLFDTIRLSARDIERAKKEAPGYDIYYLEQEWREWIHGKKPPEKPGAAFVGFCKNWYQKNGPAR